MRIARGQQSAGVVAIVILAAGCAGPDDSTEVIAPAAESAYGGDDISVAELGELVIRSSDPVEALDAFQGAEGASSALSPSSAESWEEQVAEFVNDLDALYAEFPGLLDAADAVSSLEERDQFIEAHPEFVAAYGAHVLKHEDWYRKYATDLDAQPSPVEGGIVPAAGAEFERNE